MRSRSAALALATALAGALLAAPDASAQSQKKRPAAKETVKSEWRFVRSANAPTLFYGAGAEDFQISFSCQPDTGLVRIIAQIGSRGLQPGDGAAIRLVNGKSRFEVAGTAFSTAARKDIDIGSATRLDPDLFVLFKAGETLVVEVPGRKRSLPVQNAGPSADAFQKACTATVAGARPVTG
jgi:hypothetical protein